MVSRSNDDDAEAAAELVEVGLVGGKSAGAKTSHSHLGSVDLHDASSHASLAAELLSTLLYVPKSLAQVIQSSSRFA